MMPARARYHAKRGLLQPVGLAAQRIPGRKIFERTAGEEE
jgi:hypothetical protein